MENEPLIDEPLKRELSALYKAEGRHYHSLAHIEAMLALAGDYRASLHDPEAVEAAIWFHDAIYDSRAKDNEAQKCRTCRDKSSPVAPMRSASTRIVGDDHRPPPRMNCPAFDLTRHSVRDAALFLDMDLSILGAAPDVFDAYEQAVRREYGWVEEPMWRAGRGAVLKNFLARPHIFHTEEFRRRFEAAGQAKHGAVAQGARAELRILSTKPS